MSNQGTGGDIPALRRQRIQRLKKLILLFLFAMILFPVILCMVLFARVKSLQKQIDELQKTVEARQAGEETFGNPKTEIETKVVENTYTAGDQEKSETAVLDKDVRKVYLTFDDGPSTYTNAILDILDAYDVKATFFVVGKTDEDSLNAYKRIVTDGHTLGMHSYSHKYEEIYQSLDDYATDLRKLQELLYDTTGVWSRYTRFPGGSSNRVSAIDMQECIAYLSEQGISYFDWNISSQDAASGHTGAQTIAENVLKDMEKHDTAIVLMHDAADKATTVEALPIIIEKLLAMEDTQILAIDDETVPVQHIKMKED